MNLPTSVIRMVRDVVIGLLVLAVGSLRAADCSAAVPQAEHQVQANQVVQINLHSTKSYKNPFMDVTLDAIVTQPNGKHLDVPAFWDGGSRWCFRYSSSQIGVCKYRTVCSDSDNSGLNGIKGEIQVTPSTSDNPLFRHGPIRVAADHRHFEYADGTPFFWLGDTWWKGLCKRLTWKGFQELTANRKAKGFTVVQIVCGTYPDEGFFKPSWENAGGMPYEDVHFTQMNPKYFDYADRRIKWLVNAGMVPAIVGSWGRGDCNGMALVGLAGMKRHFRNLIAHYGAYPVVWIIGGEAGGPKWIQLAQYVRKIDPFHRLITIHPGYITDYSPLDFDMLQTGHGGMAVAKGAIPQLKAALVAHPNMPVLIGEYCYEGHMQTGWPNEQRYVFWGSMLNGAAGLTYGAAGDFESGVKGDPGESIPQMIPTGLTGMKGGPGWSCAFDFETWKQGMNLPGSTQLGLDKKFLKKYPWWRFQPHPEWASSDCFAAGIPGEIRFIYMPARGNYNWTGPTVKDLEPGIVYHAFYFDPVRGGIYDVGNIMDVGSSSQPLLKHTQPTTFGEHHFSKADSTKWKDRGSATHCKNGYLVADTNMVTTLKGSKVSDAMVSVDAKSDAEAGIVLRYHNLDNYLVALYSPLFKCIYLQDRRHGQYGLPLGRINVPKIGPNIHLIAAVCGSHAAMALTDGKKTYQTPIITIQNTTPGEVGLWHFQIGDHQEFDNFKFSRSRFLPRVTAANHKSAILVYGGNFDATPAPSPQDWVLVMQRVK